PQFGGGGPGAGPPTAGIGPGSAPTSLDPRQGVGRTDTSGGGNLGGGAPGRGSADPERSFAGTGAREVLTSPSLEQGAGRGGRGRRRARGAGDETRDALDSGIQVRLGPLGSGG